jgi:NFU1 iron-sulfur cluster scaffold homolog, mitochondrial
MSDTPISVNFEATPNPGTMKFVFSESMGFPDSREFKSSRETDLSPLAAKIFGFPWTSSVFVTPQFVTVTKQDWVDWDILAEPLSDLIREHIVSGEPVLLEATEVEIEEDPNDSELVRNIKRTIASEIKPIVALDGGDVGFVRFEGSKLFIAMKGSCSGCPSASQTLKEGIEVRMKELYPEISEVLAV